MVDSLDVSSLSFWGLGQCLQAKHVQPSGGLLGVDLDSG